MHKSALPLTLRPGSTLPLSDSSKWHTSKPGTTRARDSADLVSRNGISRLSQGAACTPIPTANGSPLESSEGRQIVAVPHARIPPTPSPAPSSKPRGFPSVSEVPKTTSNFAWRGEMLHIEGRTTSAFFERSQVLVYPRSISCSPRSSHPLPTLQKSR
jgi:hypothetical protein